MISWPRIDPKWKRMLRRAFAIRAVKGAKKFSIIRQEWWWGTAVGKGDVIVVKAAGKGNVIVVKAAGKGNVIVVKAAGKGNAIVGKATLLILPDFSNSICHCGLPRQRGG